MSNENILNRLADIAKAMTCTDPRAGRSYINAELKVITENAAFLQEQIGDQMNWYTEYSWADNMQEIFEDPDFDRKTQVNLIREVRRLCWKRYYALQE